MPSEERLRLALEFVSEGRRAQVPRPLSKEVFSTESFQAETERLKAKARPWTQGAGIQGLGLGQREATGQPQKELALRVYVKRKRPLSQVKNKVPKRLRIPEVGEVPTDVLEIGLVQPEVFTSKVRPAMPGCGLGHPKVTVGTFGCLVTSPSHPGKVFILSNSHILANEGLAAIGDAIWQPGKADGGRKNDRLAKLAAFEPFQFTATGYPNLIDAAIAEVSPSRVDRLLRILGIAPVGLSHTLRRGLDVQKVGRTTDYTVGVVRDVNYRFSLRYKRPGKTTRSRVGFRDQVLCTRYTAGGDSGSVVLNMRGRAVGLHFAGSPSTSIFSPIRFVFRALDLKLT